MPQTIDAIVAGLRPREAEDMCLRAGFELPLWNRKLKFLLAPGICRECGNWREELGKHKGAVKSAAKRVSTLPTFTF